MTSAGFRSALTTVLAYEGGKSNHPLDRGGRTNKGITQKVYDSYRARLKQPPRDVYDINAIEVSEIYRLQYWRKVSGDALPDGIDVVVFDGAVNSGPVQSIKWLQRALGTVKVDGMMGEVTLSAVADYPDQDRLIEKTLDRRLIVLKTLDTWPTFGRGWAGRVAHLKAVGQALATGSVPPEPDHFAGGEARASLADARAALSPSLAAGASGGGGIAALLSTAQAQLEPFIGTSAWIERAVAVMAIVAVAVMLGGAASAWWIGRRNAKRADALDLVPVAILGMIAALFTNWRVMVALLFPIVLGLMAWRIESHGYDRGYAARTAEIAAQIQKSEGLIDEETRTARDAARAAVRRLCERQADPSACRQ